MHVQYIENQYFLDWRDNRCVPLAFLVTDEQSDEPLAQNGAAEETAEEAEGLDPAIQEKLSVYIARYSYDPASHSPNDIPDSELAFQAGDYLYVFGDMDEVGRTSSLHCRCFRWQPALFFSSQTLSIFKVQHGGWLVA